MEPQVYVNSTDTQMEISIFRQCGSHVSAFAQMPSHLSALCRHLPKCASHVSAFAFGLSACTKMKAAFIHTVSGFGFRVSGFGFRIQCLSPEFVGFVAEGFCRLDLVPVARRYNIDHLRGVSGFGVRVSGFGVRVSGFGFRDLTSHAVIISKNRKSKLDLAVV